MNPPVNQTPLLFVSGMFRSGTTLLARMLNSHPQISFASDPLRPMINSFRHDVLYSPAEESLRYAPLDDYFINTNSMQKILTSSLKQRFHGCSQELMKTLQNSAMPYSSHWAENLQLDMKVSDYESLLCYGTKLIATSYPAESAKLTGFKEVWATEFSAPLLSGDPSAKALIIVRDPRAIVASKNSTADPYPLFFLARQWRKIAYITQHLQSRFGSSRVHVLRYEDLITEPLRHTTALCEFLKIDFSNALLDTASFKDGEGKAWQQNSSYQYSEKQTFQQKSIDAWKQKLKHQDTLLTELIAGDWMDIFGYNRQHTVDDLQTLSGSQIRRYAVDELAQWIRPYSFDHDDIRFERELDIEKLRLSCVRTGCMPQTLKASYQVADHER